MSTESTEPKVRAQAAYRSGRDAFERGRYREAIDQLQEVVELVGKGTQLGGQAQVWLVSSLEAVERRQEAIALCDILTRHPDPTTRTEARRLLYILKAPRLKIRPEWKTEIPDLSGLDERDPKAAPVYTPRTTPKKRRRKPEPDPEPLDWSQISTGDNGFVLAMLVLIGGILGGLLWFGL